MDIAYQIRKAGLYNTIETYDNYTTMMLAPCLVELASAMGTHVCCYFLIHHLSLVFFFFLLSSFLSSLVYQFQFTNQLSYAHIYQTLWKSLNHETLMLTRHTSPAVRLAALQTIRHWFER